MNFEPSVQTVIAGLLSLAALGVPLVWLRSRPWTFRLLAGLGAASLLWGVAPIFGGGTLSPPPVVGAVVAFGFLILTELVDDD